MTKLNLQRPYGRIVGRYEECPEAAYSQDGKFFDVHQKFINQEDLNNGIRQEIGQQGSNEQIDDASQGQKSGNEEEESEVISSSATLEPELASVLVSEPELVSMPEPEPISDVTNTTKMTLTDKQLNTMASKGIGKLRTYAAQFGIKGRAKDEILKQLKALRQ